MTRSILLIIALFLTAISFGQTADDKAKIANRDKFLFGVTTDNRNFVETVPFTLVNNLIFTTVQIDGTSYNFLFDTGAVTILSSRLREKLHLKEAMRNTLIDGSAQEQTETFYTLNKLKLGTVNFSNIGAASMNLAKMSEQFCTPIDGIIGANLMRSSYWKIDYKNNVLIFSDKKIKPTGKTYELPFEENFSGTPLIKLFFGNYNFETIFDTGNNQSFNFPDSLYFKSSASKNKILRKGSGNTEFTLYGNRSIVNHASILDSVTIGKRLFQKQVVRISPSPLPLLGNKFLMQFDEVILDWKKHLIHLPFEYNQEEPLKTLGFDPLFIDGKVVVSFIWEGSVAQIKGLELGDTITAIDGQSLIAITAEQWCTLRDAVKEKSALAFKVLKKDGSVALYELSRYTLLE
ncbi:aspartyl protease family protein [Flavobacterium zepuense]|nr:aspartyl protease family protein [Flavobacterium zepuense]